MYPVFLHYHKLCVRKVFICVFWDFFPCWINFFNIKKILKIPFSFIWLKLFYCTTEVLMLLPCHSFNGMFKSWKERVIQTTPFIPKNIYFLISSLLLFYYNSIWRRTPVKEKKREIIHISSIIIIIKKKLKNDNWSDFLWVYRFFFRFHSYNDKQFSVVQNKILKAHKGLIFCVCVLLL